MSVCQFYLGVDFVSQMWQEIGFVYIWVEIDIGFWYGKYCVVVCNMVGVVYRDFNIVVYGDVVDQCYIGFGVMEDQCVEMIFIVLEQLGLVIICFVVVMQFEDIFVGVEFFFICVINDDCFDVVIMMLVFQCFDYYQIYWMCQCIECFGMIECDLVKLIGFVGDDFGFVS